MSDSILSWFATKSGITSTVFNIISEDAHKLHEVFWPVRTVAIVFIVYLMLAQSVRFKPWYWPRLGRWVEYASILYVAWIAIKFALYYIPLFIIEYGGPGEAFQKQLKLGRILYAGWLSEIIALLALGVILIATARMVATLVKSNSTRQP